jgi:2,4-dienoyl-CoA reductase-like NADH-dependent reductase (Old Yellow Enzyme family)
VQPSAVGQGYLNTPGLHTPAQIEGWRAVAEAVHEDGGRIVAQTMHVGRLANPGNKDGHETVAPSAVPAPGDISTFRGPQPLPVPRALETSEVPGVVAEFAQSARAAVEAGLDGVELHAANGYLPHQFLGPQSNRRTGAYGGSPTSRARFVFEVIEAMADAIGAQRVGIRISPAINIQGVLEEDPADVLTTYDQISPLNLA